VLGIDHPSEYLSLIIDGMDQNKTNIPHLVSSIIRDKYNICIVIAIPLACMSGHDKAINRTRMEPYLFVYGCSAIHNHLVARRHYKV